MNSIKQQHLEAIEKCGRLYYTDDMVVDCDKAAKECAKITDKVSIGFGRFLQTGKCWFDEKGNSLTIMQIYDNYLKQTYDATI